MSRSMTRHASVTGVVRLQSAEAALGGAPTAEGWSSPSASRGASRVTPRPRLADSVLLLYLNEDTFSEEEDESSPLTSVICRALDARPAGHRLRLECGPAFHT